jgi:hydrogenase/urease accessory protein HupE
MPRQPGTRRRPGPLFIVLLAAWFLLSSGVVRAHDPGLSALDVRIQNGTVSAQLSLAAADVALIVSDTTVDARSALAAIARNNVFLAVDGQRLPVAVADVALEGGAARVQMSFAMPAAAGTRLDLQIESDLPTRVARGHRQLVVVTANDRTVAEQLLDAAHPTFIVNVESGRSSVARRAWQFLSIGVRHIMTGFDHLVFLAGLLLAARSARELVLGLTAFTAAHSLSLALAVVAGVRAPASIVEPVIAASIAWVGLENLVPGRGGLRVTVVFGFGLIHGMGFAEALTELGFGQSASDMAVGLLSFNAGVEAGQLAVALMLLPVLRQIKSRPVWAARLLPVCSALIVLAGGYWLLERL